ncbi:MAG: hypothetical protein QGF53_07290 [Alphaproteobacteria bacterium]|nr:hypothetical protein [Alphaproteobacteria bacterium]
MVQLEATAKGGVAWSAWREAWEELDAKLESLRHRDPRAFGELMMDQQVVLQIDRRGQLAEVAKAVQAVLANLDASIGDRNLDRQRRSDLRFERSEMAELAESLEQRAGKSSTKSAARKRQRKRRENNT